MTVLIHGLLSNGNNSANWYPFFMSPSIWPDFGFFSDIMFIKYNFNATLPNTVHAKNRFK